MTSTAELARRREIGLKVESQYYAWGWTMLPTEWADTFLAGIRRIEALIAEQGSGVLVHQFSEHYTDMLPYPWAEYRRILTVKGHTALSKQMYDVFQYDLLGMEIPLLWPACHVGDDELYRFTDPDGTMDLLAAWLLRDRILVVPMPQVRIVDDRFHCEDGPSIWWSPDV